jgi:hypothetical protein
MTYDQNGQASSQNYYKPETSTPSVPVPQVVPVEQTVTYSSSNGADIRRADYTTYAQSNQTYNGQYNQGWEDDASQMNQNHVQQIEYYQVSRFHFTYM